MTTLLLVVARHACLPSVPQRPAPRLSLLLALLASLAFGLPAWAEGSSRSVFPGRRVGGGTRGECTARLVANLVPRSNVFAPGASGLIGILEGPSANLHPLMVAFKPADAAGVVVPGAAVVSREIAAVPVSLLLLKAPPLGAGLVWESSYRCEGASTDPDPLSFVSAGAPPAVSLLLPAPLSADRLLQAQLARLKAQCGGTVSKEQLATDFGLDELQSNDWPALVPIRCL